jgi:phage repressor protein C with HTH and peptisase S24 domain
MKRAIFDGMAGIGDRVRARREELGLSQAELAARCGVSQQAVEQLENGKTQRPRYILELSTALDVSPQWLLEGKGVRLAMPDQLAPQRAVAHTFEPPAFATLPRDVPVYGVAVGGDDASFLLNGTAVDQARRPPSLAGNPRVFAFYVVGTSMNPRFRLGELAYVNPARPPGIGDDVLIEMLPDHEGEPGAAYIKTLVSVTATSYVCEQYNPPGRVTFPRAGTRFVYRIVPSSEWLGT